MEKHCGFRIADLGRRDCGFGIKDLGLKIEDRGLGRSIAECGVLIAEWGVKIADGGLWIGSPDQPGRQKRCRFIGQTERGTVRDFFELLLNCRVDLRMIVAVQICPNRRIRVEIFASTQVAQNRAFARDDDRRFAFQPVTHLGEGMPDELVIKFGELVHLRLIDCNAATNCEISSGV